MLLVTAKLMTEGVGTSALGEVRPEGQCIDIELGVLTGVLSEISVCESLAS